MSGWILASERLPASEPGTWSKEVIAVTELGDVFKLSCMGEYWQRPSAMEDHDKVYKWCEMPDLP